MAHFFSTLGWGALYFVVFLVCVVATACFCAFVAVTVSDLSLKGKPDVDQASVGGFNAGFAIGGLGSIFLTAHLLYTTTLLWTFGVTVVICVSLTTVTVGLYQLNLKLYGQHAGQ